MTTLLVEVSMYPLTSQYIPAIDDFLAQLNAGNGVAVKTNRMSTQLFGEHDAVMELLTRAMSAMAQPHLSASFCMASNRLSTATTSE